MAKPVNIELPDGALLPILHEDRSVLAVDKPAGWMLAPAEWNKTSRNLQRALMLSVQAGDFWAVSRRLKYVRFIHRLDADTSGVLLLAKSPGVLTILSRLFETRRVRKKYLAVVRGLPRAPQWGCRLRLAAELDQTGRIRIDEKNGRDAETKFRVLQRGAGISLIEVIPLTGRTHQIRVHLQAAGHPVLGDSIYDPRFSAASGDLALRSIELSYQDPFQKRAIHITAASEGFLRRFHFEEARA